MKMATGRTPQDERDHFDGAVFDVLDQTKTVWSHWRTVFYVLEEAGWESPYPQDTGYSYNTSRDATLIKSAMDRLIAAGRVEKKISRQRGKALVYATVTRANAERKAAQAAADEADGLKLRARAAATLIRQHVRPDAFIEVHSRGLVTVDISTLEKLLHEARY